MTIKEVTSLIEELAPLPYAEDFDNVGLLVGQYGTKVSGVLVTLDTLESVVDEAIAKNCNLIVSFHPIVFTGIKKFNGSDHVERVIIKAIKNDIAIYAMHTALDNAFNGVNGRICDQLKLINKEILIPKKGTIKKLITFVPDNKADKVRDALFKAGAGGIGNYDECSFNIQGTGTFKGNPDSNPTIGEKGKTQFEKETQIGITYQRHLEAGILKALLDAHPYEEVAYEISTLENTNQHIGMGMVGELQQEMSETDFLRYVKSKMNSDCIRHSALCDQPIKKVAVLGGSGSFAIENAKRAGAQAFITADLKYHQFHQADNKLLLLDIGHYESEQYTKNLLVELLTKKIANFAVVLSEKITNPIKYL